MAESTHANNLQIIVLLFERVYGVKFSQTDRQNIVNSIIEAENHEDGSAGQLLDYVVRVAGELAALDPSRVDEGKRQVRDIFSRAFARGESNERGRILASVHHAIENNQPGASGVGNVLAPSPFRVMPVTPPPSSPVHEDPAAQVRQAQRDAEHALLESNIEKARHEVNMSIIKNIG